MNVFDWILIKLLLRGRKSYFRIMKMGNWNATIDIEEYIPAGETIRTFEERLHEFS